MGFLSRLFGKPSAPPTQDQFAKMAMAAIRKAGEKGRILYDKEEFRLRRPQREGSCLFLGNAYQEYNAVSEDARAKLLHNVARIWFVESKETPEVYEDAKHDLMPVVRSRTYHEIVKLLAACEHGKDTDWPQQIIAENLSVSVVYDLPEAMRTIRQEDLDAWGVSFYEALEVAKDNLRQLQHAFLGPQEGEGIYMSATHDNYDASRLLLLDTIRQFRVKGDCVAMIPNRDTLIVTGSDDEDGLKGMLALAKDALQQPRPDTALAFRLDGEDWVPWMPDATHPLFGEFRMLLIQSFGRDYENQKSLLDRLHAERGQHIFVASYQAMKNTETGRVFSYSLWPKGAVTLLPRTDRIAFVEVGKDSLLADWDRAAEVLGGLMKPMAIYPERLHVSEFPTEEQFAAMKGEKVSGTVFDRRPDGS
jgi:uncharacterized protein YtpQ (UPF0354 family)